MSSEIIPISPHAQQVQQYAPQGMAAGPYGDGAAPPPEPKTSPIVRALAALRRFKWLILGLAVLGLVGGVLASTLVTPVYPAVSRLWISSESPMQNSGANPRNPIQNSELLGPEAWVELLTTGRVTDSVVMQLGLYVQPAEAKDSLLFSNFATSAAGIRPGAYKLSVDGAGRAYTLTVEDQLIDRGAVGDSVGAPAGFVWQPDPALLTAGREVSFRVQAPREASARLLSNLTPSLQSNFLDLHYTHSDPQKAAEILNHWVERFVTVADELKRAKLVQRANILEQQRVQQREDLDRKDRALEQYRVATIKEPSEDTPISAGSAETQGTVVGRYIQQRIQASDLEMQRENIERALGALRSNTEVPTAAILQLSAGAQQHGAAPLASSLSRYNELRAEYSTQATVLTPEAPSMKQLEAQMDSLRRNVIPQQANGLVSALRQQEQSLASQIQAEGRALERIPTRTTQLQILTRERDIADGLYRTLEAEAAAAQLMAMSTTPDLEVVDFAEVPTEPQGNTAPMVILAGLAIGLGLGLLIALLVDRLDRKFRYPEQAKDDLGLDVLGTVPALRASSKGHTDPEEALQVVESFRLLRLNVTHTLGAELPLALTVSSPMAGDGKSLVSSNLALSFAEAGHRVVLLDGDIRRGVLHESFGVSQKPGLLEFLMGRATRAEILRETSHPNLTLIPCGTRSRKGPELLSSAQFPALLASLRAAYDVIIVDSPPLSAGIDPFALAAGTGSLLVVLRAGKTDVRLAQNKLTVVDRLPISVLGAVLNSIKAEGVYKYYSYDYGYGADEEDDLEIERLGAGGEVATVGGKE
ncbi:MAG TPA: polysaccharide biosynthesis tyrosine autokinase [Gemmatimonadales bacterium]|nr:polysaccharide biosynthesis tyrosine autokinase [Gemmatimonadales bacterium]